MTLEQSREGALSSLAGAPAEAPISRQVPPRLAVVGFGAFGQFLAKRWVRRGHTVFAVSRETDASKRHRALRSFQGGGSGCRVFATTFATAAVGLTLTA